MRRILIAVLVAMVILAIAVAMVGKRGHPREAKVEVRSTPTTVGEVHVEICPPYCGSVPPTTTVAPVPETVPPAPETTQPPPTEPPQPVASPRATGGLRSYAWWYALAVCETGHNPPTDEWRTGYFGLEGGQPEGGRGWDAELAEAESIYANYGDSAWGCAPVAWGAVPGG